MDLGKPLCITYTAIGTEHKWKISNDYYVGQPILKIIPLNGVLCRHRNIRICPLFDLSGNKNYQKSERDGEEKRKNERRRKLSLIYLFVILFSVLVYARSVAISVKEMNSQKHKLELFLNNLELQNLNSLLVSEGDDDVKEE